MDFLKYFIYNRLCPILKLEKKKLQLYFFLQFYYYSISESVTNIELHIFIIN